MSRIIERLVSGKGLTCDAYRNVKALVGEVDFSFHVISTADSSEETLFNKDKTE